MVRRVQLTAGWTVVPAGNLPPGAPAGLLSAPLPASVPGTVHTDLLAAGVIPDPYLDRNEAAVGWIGLTGWRYATTFDLPDERPEPTETADRVDLVIDGLDTVATVELHGTTVAATRNMHRTYRFDVTDLLRPTGNHLVITFDSPVRHAWAERDRLGALPVAEGAPAHPTNFIRKMACSFGWDWGPDLATVGIWRPVALEWWNVARLARVRPAVSLADGAGRVRVHVDIERYDAMAGLVLSARVAGVESRTAVEPGATSAVVDVEVPGAQVWWPHGHGGQPLYDLSVDLRPGGVAGAAGDAAPLSTWRRRIGFRTVELDTREDDIGSAFTLVVNGQPIFARGANWIPDDCFPSRVTRERYRERVQQAKEANIDLLRVWGGGIYESDDFYDACDEAGVLVWQDFLFACAAYPEDDATRAEVAAEAADNVVRLMPHPSLVLWNGNNENFMGWHEWGWPELVGDRAWGLGYYLDLLPAVVAELDGTRPYWPGSPYSGHPDRASGLDAYGCTHVWDVWNTADYPTYRDHVPRFVSEFGWQAPPTWSTLTAAVHDDPLTPDSPGVLAHQKAIDGNGKLLRGLVPHFPAPTSMADWHFAAQLNQARAITTAVEHFRSHRGSCMGTVVWQLNDCWPVTSWAALDGHGRRKPLWYALRRAYRPRLLTVQPRPDGLHAVAVNDSPEPWRAVLRLERRDLSGELLASAGAELAVPPWSAGSVAVPRDVGSAGRAERELLLVTAGDLRACWFFAEDKDLDYPKPEYDAVPEPGDVPRVRVSARTLLRDLCLFADRLAPDAVVDDMLVTLLPGESHTFTVTGWAGDPDALLRPPVLRTANDLVTGGDAR
jgi:beta-mannosidase